MKNRRSFLASVAGGAGIALANVDAAVAQVTAAPSPVAAPAPAASAGAIAFAATVRARFDRGLTHADLDAIARGVDANAKAAAALSPAKKRLKNSDAPVLQFRVAGDDV